MQQVNTIEPVFDPTYLNMEYVFYKTSSYFDPFIKSITDVNTWETIGLISVSISILALIIIIFSSVRLYEIQVFDREEIDHEINHALAKDKERDRSLNPKWKYILTLIESPNDSDWRVSVIEADTLLEETYKEKGLVGGNMAELLAEAKLNGYPEVQSAWDAHTTRNKIVHEGQDYPFSQIEGRRIIKLYQNVLEEMKVV